MASTLDRVQIKNELHEVNRKRWDAAAESWARGADSRGLWRRCPTEPELVLCDRELAHLGDIAGKRVCVLGSGDNQVAFARAGMEARVTSVDISQLQLDVAKRQPKASLCCASLPMPSALYHVDPVPQAARSCRRRAPRNCPWAHIFDVAFLHTKPRDFAVAMGLPKHFKIAA